MSGSFKNVMPSLNYLGFLHINVVKYDGLCVLHVKMGDFLPFPLAIQGT